MSAERPETDYFNSSYKNSILQPATDKTNIQDKTRQEIALVAGLN